jgi:hypothetical protein
VRTIRREAVTVRNRLIAVEMEVVPVDVWRGAELVVQVYWDGRVQAE